MNGFAGTVQSERQLPPSQLAAQLDPVLALLAHRGRHAPARWNDSLAACGVFGGQPASAADFPRDVQGAVIAWHGHLHNRKQVARETANTLHMPDATDAEFALAAWRRWGPGCLDRLLGDFAFAIWSPATREIFAARDANGLRPLFYSATCNRFWFSSEVRALLAAHGVSREIEEATVADFLLWWSDYAEMEQTFFRDIRRLPPGHLLRWGPAGIQVQPFVKMDFQRKVIFAHREDYAERFQELFREAVRCRLDTELPTGILLSGGLDSGAVTATAAQIQRSQLRAYTGAIPYATDESPLAAETARHCGVVQKILVTPPTRVDDLLPAYISRQASPVADLGFANDRTLFAAARADGCRTILTGDGGDELLGTPVVYIADLIRTGRWVQALDHARNFSRLEARTLSATLRDALRLVAPDLVRKAVLQMKWRKTPTWIAVELARRTCLLQRLRRPSRREPFSAISMAEDYRALVRGRRVLMDEARELEAAHLGITLSYPFLDQRLIEFLFAIPWQMRMIGTRNKWLVRDWKGLLPPAVRELAGKPSYDEYWDETKARSNWNPAGLAGNPAAERYVNFAAWEQAEPAANHAPGGGRLLTLWTLQRFLEWLNQFGSMHTACHEAASRNARELTGSKSARQGADGTTTPEAFGHASANDQSV